MRKEHVFQGETLKMAVCPIVRYPSPVLKQKAEPVQQDEAIKPLLNDLKDTLYAAKGLGITASHIGILKQVFVVDLSQDQSCPRFYLNACILWASQEKARFQEGSLSMSGIVEEVERPAMVKVAFLDENGRPQQEEVTGFMAACLQHEIDQCNGIFWLERVSRLKRERVIKKYGKIT